MQLKIIASNKTKISLWKFKLESFREKSTCSKFFGEKRYTPSLIYILLQLKVSPELTGNQYLTRHSMVLLVLHRCCIILGIRKAAFFYQTVLLFAIDT